MPLYLLPNLLGPHTNHHSFLPSSVDAAVLKLQGLIAESDREGRRYLSRFLSREEANKIPIALLNEHTKPQDYDFLMEPLIKGETWGLISDCGLPCLADPGALFVRRVRLRHLPIEAYVGPSSLFLALIQSGLTAERFHFHGYISKKREEHSQILKFWEKNSIKNRETQVFIEAPYRNFAVMQSCIEWLHPETLFCVASHLTLADQWICTAPLSQWKRELALYEPHFSKKPAIFLFSA